MIKNKENRIAESHNNAVYPYHDNPDKIAYSQLSDKELNQAYIDWATFLYGLFDEQKDGLQSIEIAR